MARFAHVFQNIVYDPQDDADLAAYKKRFGTLPDTVWSAHTFKQVGNTTTHGATDNGDGTFTNITPPAPPTQPLTLSATAFQDVCETALGGNATGRARFGAIIRAMQTSADDEVLSAFKRFDKSEKFDKAKAAPLLALLVAKGVASMTAQERTAILNGWPEA